MHSSHSDYPDSVLAHLLGNAEDLREYVQVRIPRRLRRSISCDDVLQDIWVTVFRGADAVAPYGSDEFDFWLYRVAQRRIADAIRRVGAAKRGGRNVIVYERRRTTSFVDLFARVGGKQATPSGEVFTMEAVDAIQIALAALPEDYRTAITLRYVHGSSYMQIAMAMSKSHASVCGLLHRGMRRLKLLMGSIGQFFSDDGACVVRRGTRRPPVPAKIERRRNVC